MKIETYFRRRLREHVGEISIPPPPRNSREALDYPRRVAVAKQAREMQAFRIGLAAESMAMTILLFDYARGARSIDSPLLEQLEPAWRQCLEEDKEMLRVQYEFTNDQIQELYANLPRWCRK